MEPPTITVVAMPRLASITPSVVTRQEGNESPPGLPKHAEQPFGRLEVCYYSQSMGALYLCSIRQVARVEPVVPRAASSA